MTVFVGWSGHRRSGLQTKRVIDSQREREREKERAKARTRHVRSARYFLIEFPNVS